MKKLLLKMAGGVAVAAAAVAVSASGASASSGYDGGHYQQSNTSYHKQDYHKSNHNYNNSNYNYKKADYNYKKSDYNNNYHKNYNKDYNRYQQPKVVVKVVYVQPGHYNSNYGFWYNGKWYEYSKIGYMNKHGKWVSFYHHNWNDYDWQQWRNQCH